MSDDAIEAGNARITIGKEWTVIEPKQKKPEKQQHETVGRLFKSGGAVYRCTSYDRRIGFWMELVEGTDSWLPDREVGDRANVSERAINRTYHRIYARDDEVMEKHDDGCTCYVCEARSAVDRLADV